MGFDITGDQDLLKDLTSVLLKQRKGTPAKERNEKMRRVLMLLSQGVALSVLTTLDYDRHHPYAYLYKDYFNEDDVGECQRKYLRQTVKRLERNNYIHVDRSGDTEQVILTDKGRKEILTIAFEAIKVDKRSRWDHRWRIVVYDIYSSKKSFRDKFQKILHNSGFYPLQESIYVHAYPCEKQVDLLRRYLGIDGEVRLIIAETIENDQDCREYFGV
jgi:CRISPR-associated endonuclease Cas2